MTEYKDKDKNKEISIYINSDNTTKNLWNEFKKILNKYNFPDLYYDINTKTRSTSSFFEESFVFNHPLYSFISSCCVFKLDYFFHPNKLVDNKTRSYDFVNKIFNPKKFLYFYLNYITNLKDILIDYKINELKLNKINKMLRSDDSDKSDIIRKLNSEEFNKIINEKKEKMKKQIPPLVLYPGLLPNLEISNIYSEYLLDLNFANKPSKKVIETIYETYPLYLDKKEGYTYDELADKYPLGRSTISERVENFCDSLNIDKPN